MPTLAAHEFARQQLTPMRHVRYDYVHLAHRILIVDDDAATRDGLAQLLAQDGYTVLTAGNVPAALEILASRRPDLVVTDVRVEGYNGLQLLAMAPEPVAAIVVTGFPDATIESDARRFGADYLVKPVAPPMLREAIARKLGKAADTSAFKRTRRERRRTLSAPVSMQVEGRPGRILDASAHGVRFEIADTMSGVPGSLTLQFAEPPRAIPVEVVWQRRANECLWVCGAVISESAAGEWAALLDRF